MVGPTPFCFEDAGDAANLCSRALTIPFDPKGQDGVTTTQPVGSGGSEPDRSQRKFRERSPPLPTTRNVAGTG